MARKSTTITIPITYLTNDKALGKSAGRFAKFASGIATGAAAAVAAIGTIGVAATKLASQFEDSFAKIEGLVGVSKADLGELEEAARRLGPQFGKSANEAADALFFITSAGLRGKDAVNVLEASLKGAAIGLGDTKTIADLATSAVNAYGASQLDGAKAVDVLTEAVRLGKLEPDALAQSMGQVLPLASNLGVSFGEVGAAMAGMSKTGTDASTAATQLRQILSTIAKPTAEAEKALADMGMSAGGLRQQIREEGLYATLETLTDAFDGNIEATSAVFGNIRALSGVLDLMGASAEDNREVFRQMTDDVGVLDDALGVTADTGSFKFAKAMETARASLLPIGDMLLGIGGKLLDGLMPVIDMLEPVLNETFAALEEPLLDLVALLPGLIEAFLPVLPILGDISAIVVDLIANLLPPFVALLDLLIPIFETLFEVLGPFLGEVFSQFSPLLTEVIELLIPLIEQILPIFVTLWDALAPITLNFIEAFLPIIRELLPLFTSILELAVLPVLGTLADFLAMTLPAAFDILTQLGLIPNVEAWGKYAEGVGGIVSKIRTFIAESMNVVIEALEKASYAAIDFINNMIAAGKKLPGAAGALFAGVKPLEKKAFTRMTVPGQFDNLIFPEVDTTGISDVSSRRLDKALSLGQSLGSGINTSTLAGLQELMTTRGFYTDEFGNTIFGTITPFAKGGIVTKPTIGLIGEAGPEAVVPLSKGGYGTTINITVNAGMGTDGGQVGEQIVNAIRRYERTSGPVFARA